MTGGLGAEIFGADVRDSTQFPEIYAAFAKYSVITLRKQSITPRDHLDFARRFGSINVNRFFKPVDGFPQIATVLKEKDQKEAVGEGWHTDHSYDQIPAMGSILHAIEIPPYGGDTLFVSPVHTTLSSLGEPDLAKKVQVCKRTYNQFLLKPLGL